MFLDISRSRPQWNRTSVCELTMRISPSSRHITIGSGAASSSDRNFSSAFCSTSACLRSASACSFNRALPRLRSTNTATFERNTSGTIGLNRKSTAPRSYPRKRCSSFLYPVRKRIGVWRDRGRLRISLGGFEAVHIGHPDIQQDGREVFVEKVPERLLSGVRQHQFFAQSARARLRWRPGCRACRPPAGFSSSARWRVPGAICIAVGGRHNLLHPITSSGDGHGGGRRLVGPNQPDAQHGE